MKVCNVSVVCFTAAVPFGLAGLPATAAMGGAQGIRMAHHHSMQGMQGMQGSQVGTVLLVSNLNEQVSTVPILLT